MIGAYLWVNEVGYKVDRGAVEKYPIKLTTFVEDLQRDETAVHNTYR